MSSWKRRLAVLLSVMTLGLVAFAIWLVTRTPQKRLADLALVLPQAGNDHLADELVALCANMTRFKDFDNQEAVAQWLAAKEAALWDFSTWREQPRDETGFQPPP